MKTNKPQPAKAHKSKVLDELVQKISSHEQERTEKKMLLAAKIDDARKARGWNQNQFAEAMGRQPSEVSKWLSGTHNFTVETLWDIEEKLGIELIALKEPPLKEIRIMEFRTEISRPVIVRDILSDLYNDAQIKKGRAESQTFCYG